MQDSSESAVGDLFVISLWIYDVDCIYRVDNRGSDGTGCFRIEVSTDAAELSDMRIAGLRE